MRQREENGRFRQFCDLQDGSDLFLSCPWQLSASGSIAWTSARLQKPSMQQEQQPSPQYQSIITSNSLSLFFLSHVHTQTVSIRDWTRKKSSSVQNEKGCPTAPGPGRQWRDVFSLVMKFLSVRYIYLSLSNASRGFKGKVVVFTPWMLCIFLSKGEKRCSAT